jgi:hypothetical protein
MTVRGCETVDRRTVEHGQSGGFPEAGDLEAERRLVDAIGTAGGDALQVGNLFYVRLDELRAAAEATLPVAFER